MTEEELRAQLTALPVRRQPPVCLCPSAPSAPPPACWLCASGSCRGAPSTIHEDMCVVHPPVIEHHTRPKQ
jgi:hypothetical protein